MTRLGWIGFLVVAVWSQVLSPVASFTRGTEEALRTKLLKGYNNEVRPDQVTKIFMLFHVTSISDVDIRNEVFEVSGWWFMKWNDDRLEWNETDYPTIPVVQFNENRVWTPVIVVSNSLDNLAAVGESSIPLRVDRHGTVNWNPPGLIKASCTMDISYFPFDTQTCSIEVTTFGYTIQEMDVKLFNDGLSFRYYSPSGEWDIERTYSERTEYTDDGYTYARVTCYMVISRKPLYYGLNMLLPVMICSVLTMFVFLLPPESGEKIGYCLTVLLAFMVILTLVAQDLPTTASSTSILEIYVAIVLIMGGLSVVFSIIILHIFFLPEEKPIGPCTQRVTRFFAMMCCVEGCCNSQRQRVKPEFGSFRRDHRDHRDGDTTRPTSTPPPMVDPLYLSWRRESLPPEYEGTNQITRMQMRRHSTAASLSTHRSMHEIPRHNERPRLIKEQSGLGSFQPGEGRESRDSNNDVIITWQLVSRTLDSVLFRLYALFLVISSLIFVCILALN